MQTTLEKYKSKKSITVLIKRIKPKPSIVFDTYWKFATERQNIFYKRFEGFSQPWSSDQILNSYKFTNVYRATDRVSQYLIKNVLWKGDQTPNELFFRLILFKIFNRISTWETIQSKVGSITYRDYSFKKYDKILTSVLNEKKPIYSAAYIMTSGRSAFGYSRKHQNHLRLVEIMIKDQVPAKLSNCSSMEKAYNLLLSYPTIGEFLAYQFVTDINYSSLTNFSEMEFVKAGPGAKDGIAKCFKSMGEYSFEEIIKLVAETQEIEFNRLQLDFRNLWGRNLQLIDCQNVFCEVDKYSRVAHPLFNGLSGRTRIKQRFSWEKKESICYFFPPKWNINQLIY